jgi:predicted metal-dependent peptidase
MGEAEWMIAAEQAARVARKAGMLPGGIDRAVAEAREENPDCWQVLKQFLDQLQPADQDWTTPNRRFVWQGVYLPGWRKEGIGKLGVALDCSGSIDQGLLTRFAAHLNIILNEYRPECVEVVYFDTQVNHVETFLPDEPVELHARGGGGTLFQPALDFFSNSDEPPVAVIFLTDLYGENTYGGGPEQPDYPVLWATTEASVQPAPWGERITIPDVE